MILLPPPQGLDIKEIATEAGLLSAIEREAKILHDIKENGARVSTDTIRLITFLANEIRRRIASLSIEEKQELQNIRNEAKMLDTKRKAHEITKSVQDFVEAVNTPKTAVRFSEINQLEAQVSSMIKALDEDQESYAQLLEEMKTTLKDLDTLKNKSSLLRGFEEF